MPISELYTGSETITTTEWSMTTDTSGPDTDTTDGVFQAFIDLANIENGDVFRFRIYEKDRGSGTQRPIFENFFVGVQGIPLYVSPPFILIHGWDMTLLKISGTDRTITWSIRQIS